MKIKTIPAKNIPCRFKPLRVAAYCRVSTEQDIQYHSLEVQREYFHNYISNHPNWVFVDIYADQSSGRHNVKMKEFQRMLNDCRAGKIDYIVVKSISRLGRNTVQFLQACNEFKALNIDVFFEVEKLHINDPEATKALTILESLYQQESETKSYSIRWSNLWRFKDGSSKFYNRKCYGYCHDNNGNLIIVPEEAEVVKLIYKLRSEGDTLSGIARQLMDKEIPAPRGGKIWRAETVSRILKNEKYYGDVCLQKTYIADYFTGKQVPNRGEYTSYLFENHHEGIIKKQAP